MPLILDIETVPNDKVFSPEMVEKYLPEFKPKKKDEVNKDMLTAAYEGYEEKLIKAKSLDPDFGRIACIGIIFYDTKEDDIINEKIFINENEKQLLEDFWKYIADNKIFFSTVTFNGLGFDLPFLFKRTIYNGVKTGVPVQLKRFTYFPHFDVMQALNFWSFTNFKSLSFYAEAFGIKKEEKDSTLIHGWWENKEFDKITTHCLNDCRLTLEIFRKIKDYYPIG